VAATTVATDLSSIALCSKQLEDDTTGPILEAREANCNPDAESMKKHSRAVCQLFQLWDQLAVVDGVIYQNFEYFKGKQDHLQLVVPNSMRETVLEESHVGSLGGGGIREKMELLARLCRTGQTMVQNL